MPPIKRLLITMCLIGLIATFPTIATQPHTAKAVTISPFVATFNAQINGGVVFAQNSSLSCNGILADGSRDATGCTTVRNGGRGKTTNNLWRMNHVDTDNDTQTFNSTSSELSLPKNVTVVYAALYWGARLKGTNGLANAAPSYDRVKFRTPTSGGYVDVVAQPANIIISPATKGIGEPYQARAIVTDLVKNAGAGTYTVANLAAGLGVDRYAGWTLAVVFQDPSRPLRDITLFDGLVNVREGDNYERITVSGFTAPVEGAVDATVGLVAYDGDRGNVGDFADFNDSRLSSSASPATDYFNSTIDTFGSEVLNRTPADRNTLGFDVKVADATGLIPNSATSASISVGTRGESVIVGLISTRIDLRAPRFPSVKSVVNTNGNTPAQIGDTLRYQMSFTNTGDDPADNFTISDPLPAGTTYVPGSLVVDSLPATDSGGDDRAEVSSDGRTVTARVGTGASATSGGRVAIDATHTISFDVTVNAGTEGAALINIGSISYVAATLQEQITSPTNTVTTQVFSPTSPVVNTASAQLEVSIVMPERVIPQSIDNGEFVVGNVGVATADSVTAEFPIPTEITVTTVDPRCVVDVSVVRCSLISLASGNKAVFPFDFVTIEKPASDNFLSTVTATALGIGPVTATAKTNISVDADLAVNKRVTTSSRTRATFTLTATNNGPSTATKIVLKDVLPDGMDFVSSPTCKPDRENDHLITCRVGTLQDGEKETHTIVVSIKPDVPLTNEASVSYAGLDRSPDNNTDTESVGILPATGINTQLIVMWSVAFLVMGSVLTNRLRAHFRTQRF